MISYPSMAESLDKELDRYEEEYDQSSPDQQQHCLRPSFIHVFPAHAKAEIESQIKETETRLAGIIADSVSQELVWDRPSFGKAQIEPHCVSRRTPPTPNGLEEIVRSVQSTIKHDSGATIRMVVLRKLLGDVFEAVSRGDAIIESKNHANLYDAVRDAVLKHWKTDKTFFADIPRPTAEHGVSLSFWSEFLHHGFLLRRLKLAEDQPQEVMELEPLLIEVLKLRGHEPSHFFGANSSVQESWFAEARERYNRIQGSLVNTSPSVGEPTKQDYWNIPPESYARLVQRYKETKMELDTEYYKCRLEDFRGIMKQLSLEPNFFVTSESYQNAELIFRGHFSNPKELTDPRNLINWIGTGPAYRFFFKKLILTGRINRQAYAPFFASHFKCKGKLKQDVKKINDWCRDARRDYTEPSDDAKKLENILR